jgi:hypothetical protein
MKEFFKSIQNRLVTALVYIFIIVMIVMMFLAINDMRVKACDHYSFDHIQVKYNSNVLDMPDEPMMVRNRVYVPLRKLAETIGFNVSWNQEKFEATLTNDGNVIVVKLESDWIKHNGHSYQMDVIPVFYHNRVYVPVRVICEIFGKKVNYIHTINTVEINDMSDRVE